MPMYLFVSIGSQGLRREGGGKYTSDVHLTSCNLMIMWQQCSLPEMVLHKAVYVSSE